MTDERIPMLERWEQDDWPEEAFGKENGQPAAWRALALQADAAFEKLHPRGRKGEFIGKGLSVPKFGSGETFESTLDLDPDLPTEVFAGMDDASRAVSKVHHWPQVNEGQKRGKAEAIDDPALNAQWRGNPDGTVDEYRLGTVAKNPAVNLVHEMGHGLDYGALAARYNPTGKEEWHPTGASDLAFDKARERRQIGSDWVPGDAMEGVALAIQNSETWDALNKARIGLHKEGADFYLEGRNRDFAEYMMTPTEAFARAYEQYVSTHADDPEITSEFEAEQRVRKSDEEAGSTTSTHWYWPEDDFKPVDEAFGKLFKELGWDKPQKPPPPASESKALAISADAQFEQLHPRGRRGHFIPKGMRETSKFGQDEWFADFITVDESLPIEQQGLVLDAVDGASAAVARSHRWPTPEEGQARATAEMVNDPELNAQYQAGGYPDPPGDHYRLGNQADHPVVNMLHELGHGLDYGALSERYGHDLDTTAKGPLAASGLNATNAAFNKARARLKGDPVTSDPPDALENLALAIQKSATWKEINDRADGKAPDPTGLMSMMNDPYYEYMRVPTETFGRAYEQYIANHANDAEIDAMENEEKAIRNTPDSWSEGVFYWPDEDFKEIDAAFTDLFKDMGLDKPKPKPAAGNQALAISADAEFEKLHPRGRKGQFTGKVGVPSPSFGAADQFIANVKIMDSDLPPGGDNVTDGIEEANKAVAKVHRWPNWDDDRQREAEAWPIDEPDLQAQFAGGGGDRVDRGNFSYHKDQYRIGLATSSPGLALIHEMGHGLDYGALSAEYGEDIDQTEARDPRLKTNASSLAFNNARNGLHVTPLDDVAAAIQESDGYKRLWRVREIGEYSDASFAEYMARPSETWARAYAQYIALHAHDPTIDREMKADRGLRQMEHDYEGADSSAEWFWSDEDFKPIDKAMTKMMEDLGWDKPSGRQ